MVKTISKKETNGFFFILKYFLLLGLYQSSELQAEVLFIDRNAQDTTTRTKNVEAEWSFFNESFIVIDQSLGTFTQYWWGCKENNYDDC